MFSRLCLCLFSFLFLHFSKIKSTELSARFQVAHIKPHRAGSAERSEYQSDLSKGIPACSHHFYSSGHTQPLVITSRPQSLPSHTLASKRRRRRISCRFKRKLQSKDKRYYSPSSGRARDLTAAHSSRQRFFPHISHLHATV